MLRLELRRLIKRDPKMRILAVAMLFTVATVAGCSVLESNESNGQASIVVTNLPAQNIENWVMPMDGSLIADADDFMRVYAESLLVQDCLAVSGMVSPVPSLDVTAMAETGLRGGDGMRNLSERNALKYGYLGSPDRKFLEGLDVFIEWSANQTGDNATAVASCASDAFNYFETDLVYENSNVMGSLIGQGLTAAYSTDEVTETVLKWRVCVAGRGVAGSADTPAEMPTSAMVDLFGVDSGDTREAWVPSTLEIEWATADAKCQVESGYRDALYAAEWDAQVEILGKQGDDIRRARANLDDWRASIQTVIAAHPAERK